MIALRGPLKELSKGHLRAVFSHPNLLIDQMIDMIEFFHRFILFCVQIIGAPRRGQDDVLTVLTTLIEGGNRVVREEGGIHLNTTSLEVNLVKYPVGGTTAIVSELLVSLEAT